MQLSTSTNICAFQRGRDRLPVEFSIDACAAAGYKIMDMNFCIAMNPESEMHKPNWEQYVRDIGAYAASKGIRFTQSHLPYYDVSGEKDPSRKEFMEEMIRRSILGSGILGVSWAVTHPFTVYEAGHDVCVNLEENLRYYRPHVTLAAEHGLGIALENDFEYQGPIHQRIYCASIPELTDLCDAFEDPAHVGICYDFGHANLTGGFHRQNLNMIGSRLKAIHVQDNHGKSDEHLLPLYGSIDWEACMAGLADIGWKGELTYEIQEFGRYLPKELKHLAVEQSVSVGKYLISLFEKYNKQ